jgi:hypothetical protein
LRVFGTKATFIIDDAGPRVHRRRQDGAEGEPLSLAALPSGKGALIPAFVDTVTRIAGSAPARPQQDLDVVTVCITADEARLNHTTDRIEYL